MSEKWIRDDGWEITVEQREPLVTSRIPLTNLTLSGGIVNYEMFVEAALASGYVLANDKKEG